MASEVIGNLTDFSTTCSGQHQGEPRSFSLITVSLWGNPPMASGFPLHKGPVMCKVFLFHYGLMLQRCPRGLVSSWLTVFPSIFTHAHTVSYLHLWTGSGRLQSPKSIASWSGTLRSHMMTGSATILWEYLKNMSITVGIIRKYHNDNIISEYLKAVYIVKGIAIKCYMFRLYGNIRGPSQ